jgi:hypothetical protein
VEFGLTLPHAGARASRECVRVTCVSPDRKGGDPMARYEAFAALGVADDVMPRLR